MKTQVLDGVTDEVLVARARVGDDEAFGVLIERHQAATAGLLVAVLRDWDTAEDVAQQAWIRAFRNLRKFEGRSSFKTWVTRIALNEARSRLRRDWLRRCLPLLAPRDPGEDGTWEERLRTTRPEEGEGEAIERRLDLERAMADLSPREREIAAMRLEGYSLGEIADALGISAGTVKSTLFEATRKMRRALC